jgi:histidine ammonia-lyase
MGANSALQLNKIVENVKYILGIEMFTAAQALEFRKPLKSSRKIEKLLSDYRKDVRFIEKDEVMHDHIISSLNFIDKLNINDKLII